MNFKKTVANYIVWGLFCVALFAGIGVAAIGFSEKMGNTSYLIYVGLFYALFLVSVAVIMLGYKPVRNNMADKLEAERKRISGLTETILVVVVAITAIIVRFGITLLLMDSQTSMVFTGTGAYFEYAIGNIDGLGTGENIAFLFTDLLKALFSVFGKTFIAVYVLQSFFTVGIMLFVFYAMKDLTGRFCAWLSLIMIAYLPGSVYLFMECSPGLFYTFLFSAYLFAAVKLCLAIKNEKINHPKHFLWFGLLGLFAGLIAYLDISGLALIPVTLYAFFMLRRKIGTNAVEKPLFQSLVYFGMSAFTLIVSLFGFPAGLDAGVSGIARYGSAFLSREGMNYTILTPHFRSWDSLILLIFAGLWMIVFLRIRRDYAMPFAFVSVVIILFSLFTMDHTDYTGLISVCFAAVGAIGARNIGKMYVPAAVLIQEEEAELLERKAEEEARKAEKEARKAAEAEEKKESETEIEKEIVKDKDIKKLSKEARKLAKKEKRAQKKGVILLGKTDPALEAEIAALRESEEAASKSAAKAIAEKTEEVVKEPATEAVAGVIAVETADVAKEAEVAEVIGEKKETVTEEPAASVAVDETVKEEAAIEQSVSEQPETVKEEPIPAASVEEFAKEEPAIIEPVVDQPVAEEAVVIAEPVTEALKEEPAIEQPVAVVVEEPVIAEPVVETAKEEPVVAAAEEPVAEPVKEESAIEQPTAVVAEAPIAEETKTEPVVTENATTTETAEPEEKKAPKKELPPYVPQKMVLRSRGKMFTPVKKAEVALENNPELLTKPMASVNTAELPVVSVSPVEPVAEATTAVATPAFDVKPVENVSVEETKPVENIATEEVKPAENISAESIQPAESIPSEVIPAQEESAEVVKVVAPAPVSEVKPLVAAATEETKTAAEAITQEQKAEETKPVETTPEKPAMEEKKAEEKPSFIKNPLPGPKPHVSRELVFDYELKDDEWDYDLKDISGKEYYDI
ncbi:MAG: hypothetical protein IKI20_04715 [Lachnospiraceae bacterium]|nr:hypothetical protein [Lachnospiraceae bacterium]